MTPVRLTATQARRHRKREKELCKPGIGVVRLSRAERQVARRHSLPPKHQKRPDADQGLLATLPMILRPSSPHLPVVAKPEG